MRDVVPRAHLRMARAAHGTTLLEMLVVVAIVGVLCAIAVPQGLSGLDDLRARAAARYLAARFQDARLQAVKRSARVGVRFAAAESDFTLGTYADGNRNGVRTKEIASGADHALMRDVAFASLFPHVRIAIGAGVPLIDGGASTDPV